MRTTILKVFLRAASLALPIWCHAASPTFLISNLSSTQSLFVISDCTLGVTTASSAEGGFLNSYYIGKGGSNSLTWTVPSSNCVVEIPGINSYLYFDSTGVSQDGIYLSTARSITYLMKYPTSSLSTVPATTLASTYTDNYIVTYATSYASGPMVTFTVFDYSSGATGSACGSNGKPYTNFSCSSGNGCYCNGTNCTCLVNSASTGSTCGANGKAYSGYSCASSNGCVCSGNSCTCQVNSGGTGATCGANGQPYTYFSCTSGNGCYCDSTGCICVPNSKGAACGFSNTNNASFPCATGTSCTCSSSSLYCSCQ